MSNRINQEPPALGPRTNKGTHRVVREAGAKTTEITEVVSDNPVSIQPAAAQESDNHESRHGTQDIRERAQAARTSRAKRANRDRRDGDKESTNATEMNSRKGSRKVQDKNERENATRNTPEESTREVTSQEVSAQEMSAPETSISYTRSARAKRLADELFVDKGIAVADENNDKAREEREPARDEKDADKQSNSSSAKTRNTRSRRRQIDTSDEFDSGSRAQSQSATQSDAQSAPSFESQQGTQQDAHPRSGHRVASRVNDDAEFSMRSRRSTRSAVSAHNNDSLRNEQSADNARGKSNESVPQETEASRTHRARSAVSQMLEFSSSDSAHDTAQSSEQFGTRANPMMSLLFQAPVIPQRTENTRSRYSENDNDDERPSHRSRHTRGENSRNNDVLDSISQALDETERSRRNEEPTESNNADYAEESSRENNSRRVRRGRKNLIDQNENREHDKNSEKLSRTDRNDRFDHSSKDGNSYDDYEDDNKSRRSRRLNAQERRAAAEVELIENDIEFDDISYGPIEVEEDFDNDTNSQTSQEENSEQTERMNSRSRRSHKSIMNDDDNDEEFTTRRRRRRHSKNTEDDQDQKNTGESNSREDTPTRSRKQQYIDEITDIAGSTRLEAKRQRRRDNRRDRNRQAALITEQDFLARREVVNRIMVVRERGSHTQVSVIEDDVLVEHYISDIAEVSAVGNIYQGRIQNVLPSMEAAFVDIGQMRNGVLYAGEVNWDTTRLEGQPRRMEHAFQSGDPVLVQVTKDPIGHKGARLTSQVTLAGRFLVLVPSGGMTGVSRKLPERERARLKSIVSKVAPEEMGVIIRTAAEGASEEAIIKDLEHLKNQWTHISAQLEEYKNSKKPHLLQGEPDVVIRVIRDIFNDDFKKLVVEGEGVYERIREYIESAAPDLLDRVERWDPAEHRGKDVFDRWQIDSQLRKGMERQVYLPSGGSLVIDRTEAMTTIDVNTGRFIGKGKSLEETVTRCNLEAAEEVVRQLRLRDIGGMVMIDFVDMVMPANRDLVLRRLVECLSRDRTKHQVAEVTSLGLVQMTRKRVGQGLVEAFSEECPTCGGRGFILHDEPTVSSQYDDPYAVKGGDPFVKTNKHTFNSHSANNYSNNNSSAGKPYKESSVREDTPGTTDAVKHSMAAIAAAGANSTSNGNDSNSEKPRNSNSADESVEAVARTAEMETVSHEDTRAPEVTKTEDAVKNVETVKAAAVSTTGKNGSEAQFATSSDETARASSPEEDAQANS